MRAVLLIALLLTACSNAEPFDYQPIDRIPAGPGLLTGEEGEFVIHRR
jgi:hypothetical protein